MRNPISVKYTLCANKSVDSLPKSILLDCLWSNLDQLLFIFNWFGFEGSFIWFIWLFCEWLIMMLIIFFQVEQHFAHATVDCCLLSVHGVAHACSFASLFFQMLACWYMGSNNMLSYSTFVLDCHIAMWAPKRTFSGRDYHHRKCHHPIVLFELHVVLKVLAILIL